MFTPSALLDAVIKKLIETKGSLLVDPWIQNMQAIAVQDGQLVAAVANIYFNGISGTGNTQAALWLETGTLVIYAIYIFIIGWWAKAPVAICFTTEILYYGLLFVSSLIYLKKAKWQNKKIWYTDVFL